MYVCFSTFYGIFNTFYVKFFFIYIIIYILSYCYIFRVFFQVIYITCFCFCNLFIYGNTNKQANIKFILQLQFLVTFFTYFTYDNIETLGCNFVSERRIFMSKEFPEDIQKMFEKFSKSTDNTNFEDKDTTSSQSSSFDNIMGNIDMNTLLKLKSVMEKMKQNQNNPRSQLLYSLRPYLRDSRKNKLEQYIQLLNMSDLIDGLGIMGGENKK